MGLVNHTKQKDKLIKYLKSKNISYKEENDKVEIELLFKDRGFSLFPYFVVDDDNDTFSIVINIKKIDKPNLEIYEKIIKFNKLSHFFTMKVSDDNVIYVEYNTYINDNVVDIFEEVINTLYALSDYIDNI